jgi:hypothetical protein
MTWLVAVIAIITLGLLAAACFYLITRAISEANKRMVEEVNAAHQRGMMMASRAEERADAFLTMMVQQHSAETLEMERGWSEKERRWNEERMLLLDRLTDREGRQITPFMPPQRSQQQESREPHTLTGPLVDWDADLAPLGDEGAQAVTPGGDET